MTTLADDAQRELDAALPALDAALASLKNLSKNDIVEVRSLQNPPMGVKKVMEAACIMFDEKPKMKDDPDNMGKHNADTESVLAVSCQGPVRSC
jgi:dynein heavy chain